MEPRLQILTIAGAIEATFSTSDWKEIGYLTGMHDWIDGHSRLLRSLSWGDDDYKGHVIDAVALMIEKDPDNLKRLVENEQIATWLRTHKAPAYQQLVADSNGILVEDVTLSGSSDAALSALADAQVLLERRGPTSAVDRVHTGLHGFLKAACQEVSIPFDDLASPNQLLKLLLEHHPGLADLGPRTQEVRKLVRSSASMVDSMGTVRNRSSLAHPNDELLGHDEACLVINLGRSLLRFLDAKLHPPQVPQETLAQTEDETDPF